MLNLSIDLPVIDTGPFSFGARAAGGGGAPRIKLQGAMLTVWGCRDQEVLVEGPAGTAKTRTILELLDSTARQHKGARILIIRKTRASMTHSVMATFDRFVQRDDCPFNTTVQAYKYTNGSIIAVGGMDKPTKILSSEWDIVYCNEANELTENEHETLTTRLRAGTVPAPQIISDCNPDADIHWLNQRANTDVMTRIVTRHEDNPLYYDMDKGEFTDEGKRYINGVLDKLTGVRFLRYRKGIWAAREGLVYDEFDRNIHVIKSDQLPKLRSIYRAIDFGFTNPFVCSWYGTDHDGRLYLFREIYHSQRTVKVHSEKINRYKESITASVADHDAEDRATLQENGIYTVAANKAITRGIDLVKERLKIQGDGKPRLFVVDDALVELDGELRSKGLPTCTLDEFGSYCWPEAKRDRNDKEVPVDAYNHGMDALRYMVMHLDGDNTLPASESIEFDVSTFLTRRR
jgi:phage terminase large subunit